MTNSWIYCLLIELEGLLAMMTPKELANLLHTKKDIVKKHDKEYEKALLLILKLLGEDK